MLDTDGGARRSGYTAKGSVQPILWSRRRRANGTLYADKMIVESRKRTTSQEGLCRLLLACAGLALGSLIGPAQAGAQLVLDQPTQRWRPGQILELYLPSQGDDQQVDVEQVLFDEQPVPFDLLPPRSPEEAVRVRIRVPAGIKPGGHEISALFSQSRLATVPAVVGLPLEEARRALEARGFRLDAGGFTAEPSEVLSHVVARQTPAAGQPARPGARIAAVISTRTDVPDVAGLALEEARAELEPRGLELDLGSIVIDATPDTPLTVVRYEPAAGTTVAAGSRITVREIAIGVPELVGFPVDVARQRLLDSGLVPLVSVHEPADGPYETVLVQRPAADEPAPPGTEVRLAIESRPDPPGARWPVPEAVVVAALSVTLWRMRMRRMVRKEYKIEAHNDLDRLREQSRSPDLEDRELGLDLCLSGHPDPGRQILEVDGPLILEEAG